MYKQPRPPPAERARRVHESEFDPEWCWKVVPAYVAAGAIAALLLAVWLVKADFSYSLGQTIFLVIWCCVVAAMGAMGGMFVGFMSCSAARSAGAALYEALAGWPNVLRRGVTLVVQCFVLATVGLLGLVWVAFSGGDGSAGYRGM